MAYGTQSNLVLQDDELSEILGERNPMVVQPAVGHIRLQGIQGVAGIQVSSYVNSLTEENAVLHREISKLRNVVQNSKFETADLCARFGKLADDWSDMVKQINAIHDEQKKDYEKRIEVLKKTNQQLLKENQEMKKVIADFKKLESEFEKQKRILKLGQIAYKLEILVSEYVFPGGDKASKRARYGANLKSLKEKIGNMKDQRIREKASTRLEGLNEEIFEEWFLGIVKELKSSRLDAAHPNLGTYEEMEEGINEEFSDDNDKREDMLTALQHLKEMYKKLGRRFGGLARSLRFTIGTIGRLDKLTAV